MSNEYLKIRPYQHPVYSINRNAGFGRREFLTSASINRESSRSVKNLLVKLDNPLSAYNYEPTINSTTTTATSIDQNDLSPPRKEKQPAETMRSNVVMRKEGGSVSYACFIIQQYFIYFILLLMIVLASFGFHYWFLLNGMKMSELERRLEQKISNRLSIRVFNSKDEFKNQSRFYMIRDETAATTNEEEFNWFSQNNYLLRRVDNFDFVIVPVHAKQSSSFLDDIRRIANESCQKRLAQLDSMNDLKKKSISFFEFLKSNQEEKSLNITSTVQASTVPTTTPQPTTSISTEPAPPTTSKLTTSLLTSSISTTMASSKINLRPENESKMNKSRQRKRIENKNSTIEYKFSLLDRDKCSLGLVGSKPTHVVFMGVFHCAWMNNINGANPNTYYVSKGYKSSSLTVCSSIDELRSYRCYRHMPMQHSYYGTGHAIYNNFIFYNQDGTSNLVAQGIESAQSQTNRIRAPSDAACCNIDDSLYNVKHSGFFDFEADENGLWLIYKMAKEGSSYEYDDQANEMKSNDWVLDQDREEDETLPDVYIIAKMDDQDLLNMRIVKKWTVRANRDNLANMFIVCGRLYGLRNTMQNPAQVFMMCDMMSGDECVTDHDQVYNLTISSRQITSLKYDPAKRLLYMVDGGSFVYHKLEI